MIISEYKKDHRVMNSSGHQSEQIHRCVSHRHIPLFIPYLYLFVYVQWFVMAKLK